MTVDDPFCFYPGDFTIFFALTIELMVRKMLQENGYDQRAFGKHLDMSDALNGIGGIYASDNVEPAINFIKEALLFIGCRVRVGVNKEGSDTIAVKLPKDLYFTNDKDGVLEKLNQGLFFEDWYYNVKLGRRNTVFYVFDQEFGNDWRCLADIVQGIIKLCKGGLAIGSGNYAA